MTGKTRCVAILGHPISHSKSPQMHQAAFEALKLDFAYLPFDIEPRKLESAVNALKTLGFSGFNVTVPFKEKIIPLLDVVAPDARIIGAVNTVLIKDNKLTGFNTDGKGFIRSVQKAWKIRLAGKKIVIIGAGGSSKAIAVSLCMEKAVSIGILNRTLSKGRNLSDHLARLFRRPEIFSLPLYGNDTRDAIAQADLLINTTSLGLNPKDPSPLPSGYIRPGMKVYDLIYNPAETRFLKEAKKTGCQVLNGSSMLLCQGALAFEIWTGKMPPLAVMAQAIDIP
ncbi:MAG TPA: shikimate dehydrogenase [Nitrospiria bacterium]|nr:shikimate dehydrogenase [Nitrospiria bacterium]